MKFYRILPLIILLGGCSVYRPVDDPLPAVAVPAAYSGGVQTQGDPGRWWELFGDPRLDQVVAAVLAENLDLKMASDRLDQAAALAGQAGSARVPVINLEVQNARARTNVARTSPLSGTTARHGNQHSLSLGAAYELDLWGRIAAQDRAAELDFAASRMDLEALQMTMASQTAELWFSLIEQQAQLELLEKQLTLNETYLELVEMRFGLGLADSGDVFRQRQQVAALKAQIPMMRTGLQVMKHQLNILLAKAPGADLPLISGAFPELWPRPAAGIPSDLLQRRPDVQAARIRVMAADNRVGAAVADRYPSFAIAAATGYSATDYSDLLENWVWSVADSIAVSVYDGHRKNRVVEQSKARMRELLNGYSKAFLVAVQEVDDALLHEQSQQIYLSEIGAREQLAQATLDQARRSYLNGLNDYLSVLTALQALQQIQQDVISARHQLLSYRIELCRALGGTWTGEIKSATDTGVEK